MSVVISYLGRGVPPIPGNCVDEDDDGDGAGGDDEMTGVHRLDLDSVISARDLSFRSGGSCGPFGGLDSVNVQDLLRHSMDLLFLK